MVIDPTDLNAKVAKDWCWTIFNLSLTQNTCLFTDGDKAIVWSQPSLVCYCCSDLLALGKGATNVALLTKIKGKKVLNAL